MWKHYAGLDYDPIIDIETVKTVDGQNIQDLPTAERAAGMGKACAEVSSMPQSRLTICARMIWNSPPKPSACSTGHLKTAE